MSLQCGTKLRLMCACAVSVCVNQSSSKHFSCLFRDHAEWLVDVLLPQGKECLTPFQSVSHGMSLQ